MEILAYLHCDKEDPMSLCEEYGLDPDVFYNSIKECLYEIEIKIKLDLDTGSAKIIEIDGRPLS